MAVIEATEAIKPACLNCKTPIEGGVVCRDHLAWFVERASFSVRMDPQDPNVVLTEYRRVNAPLRGYHVTGDAALVALTHFCIHYLHGIGVLPDDFAFGLVESLGPQPETDALPWAASVDLPTTDPSVSPTCEHDKYPGKYLVDGSAAAAPDDKLPPKPKRGRPKDSPVRLVSSSMGDTVAVMPDDDDDDQTKEPP
jgi:hypothetical protein